MLYRLAERVARNREVMGLHYPSDSRAGFILAKGIADILLRLDHIPKPDPRHTPPATSFMTMNDMINLAHHEWDSVP